MAGGRCMKKRASDDADKMVPLHQVVHVDVFFSIFFFHLIFSKSKSSTLMWMSNVQTWWVFMTQKERMLLMIFLGWGATSTFYEPTMQKYSTNPAHELTRKSAFYYFAWAQLLHCAPEASRSRPPPAAADCSLKTSLICFAEPWQLRQKHSHESSLYNVIYTLADV